MKYAILTATLLLGACSVPPVDEAVGPQTTMSVAVDPGGACANIGIATPSGARAVLEQACHGWDARPCGSGLLVRAGGVRIDRAMLTTRAGRIVDLRLAVGEAVARRWPNQELLQLSFAEVDCDAPTGLSFTGGRIGRGVSGPADDVAGRIVLDRAGAPQVILTEAPATARQ